MHKASEKTSDLKALCITVLFSSLIAKNILGDINNSVPPISCSIKPVESIILTSPKSQSLYCPSKIKIFCGFISP